MVAVYMTVQGCSRDTTHAITDSQARLGVESSKDWLDGVTPRFVDYPFTDPNATYRDHLSVVRDVCPEVAVAPDIEKGKTLEEVTAKADELLEYADAVVVVPKSVPPEDVPRRFRVGLTLASFGSSAPWSVWRYRDCRSVHLLGGGPTRQLSMGQYLSNVESVDTSALGKACRFGWWDGVSEDAPPGLEYRERLRVSLDNYVDAWRV